MQLSKMSCPKYSWKYTLLLIELGSLIGNSLDRETVSMTRISQLHQFLQKIWTYAASYANQLTKAIILDLA